MRRCSRVDEAAKTGYDQTYKIAPLRAVGFSVRSRSQRGRSAFLGQAATVLSGRLGCRGVSSGAPRNDVAARVDGRSERLADELRDGHGALGCERLDERHLAVRQADGEIAIPARMWFERSHAFDRTCLPRPRTSAGEGVVTTPQVSVTSTGKTSDTGRAPRHRSNVTNWRMLAVVAMVADTFAELEPQRTQGRPTAIHRWLEHRGIPREGPYPKGTIRNWTWILRKQGYSNANGSLTPIGQALLNEHRSWIAYVIGELSPRPVVEVPPQPSPSPSDDARATTDDPSAWYAEARRAMWAHARSQLCLRRSPE